MESAVGQPQSKTDSKPNAAAGTQPKQQPTAQGDSSKNGKADGAGVAGKDGAAPDAKGVVKAATKHMPPETADVAQKAQTQNNSRKEEVAAKKAEATKAVEDASAKKDTVISASEQLTSAQGSNFITEFLESFDRDTYVQNWRQAKTKAAGDVAVSYRDGLINNANEKANELSTSQSEVLDDRSGIYRQHDAGGAERYPSFHSVAEGSHQRR
jgi:hypothetical protein